MILTETHRLQHTQAVKEYIELQIAKNGGQITFAEYMQHALYAPGLGYYSAGNVKFGSAGDFTTAPEMGSLFAKCVARQVQEICNTFAHPVLLELGAGSGRFACDLLTQLEEWDCLPSQYLILEVSPDLRWRQQELVTQKYARFAHLVHWTETLPTEKFTGVVFANEVIDAMPISKFLYTENTLQEYYVKTNKDGFAFVTGAATPKLADTFHTNNIAAYLTQPYTSEVNIWLAGWIKSLAACIHSGVILLCDYGFSRAQYYHPQRHSGTIMCHYKHQAHCDPLIHVGVQDITAHVDFTAVAEAALANDLYVSGYTNMSSFLINCGITEFIDHNSFAQKHEVNTLTSPAEMGELFKVMLLSRMQQEDFLGFKHFDKTHTL